MPEKEGEIVVEIEAVPILATFKGPIPNGSGGAISYSNHELGIPEIKLKFPVGLTVGDEESEARLISLLARGAAVISEAVHTAFWEQFDRLDAELRARGGYRPKTETPDSL